MEQRLALRRKAIALRKQGLSYGEIKKRISVAKSSLSYWLKDIPLSPEHRKRLYTKQIQILSMGAPSQKERRKRQVDEIVLNAKSEIRLPLSAETFRFLGAALYWAEGSKSKSFEVTNSDPALVAFMVTWFEKTFSVPRSTFKVRLNIYPQQNETDIKKFWSHLTGIPITNFGKTFVKPENKGYKKNNLYYGTIKIRVPKGTDMMLRVFGWIKGALQDFTPQIQSAERKWSSLRSVERPPVNLRPLIA